MSTFRSEILDPWFAPGPEANYTRVRAISTGALEMMPHWNKWLGLGLFNGIRTPSDETLGKYQVDLADNAYGCTGHTGPWPLLPAMYLSDEA